jgi:hypothetical protein
MQSVSGVFSGFAQRVFRTRPRFAVGKGVPEEELASDRACLVEDEELAAEEQCGAAGVLLRAAVLCLRVVWCTAGSVTGSAALQVGAFVLAVSVGAGQGHMPGCLWCLLCCGWACVAQGQGSRAQGHVAARLVQSAAEVQTLSTLHRMTVCCLGVLTDMPSLVRTGTANQANDTSRKRKADALNDTPQQAAAGTNPSTAITATVRSTTATSARTSTMPVLTVRQVKVILESCRTNELPTFVPYQGVLRLIAQFQGFWRAHANWCLEEVGAKVRTLLERHIKKVFRTFPQAQGVVRWVHDVHSHTRHHQSRVACCQLGAGVAHLGHSILAHD